MYKKLTAIVQRRETVEIQKSIRVRGTTNEGFVDNLAAFLARNGECKELRAFPVCYVTQVWKMEKVVSGSIKKMQKPAFLHSCVAGETGICRMKAHYTGCYGNFRVLQIEGEVSLISFKEYYTKFKRSIE